MIYYIRYTINTNTHKHTHTNTKPSIIIREILDLGPYWGGTTRLGARWRRGARLVAR